LPDDARWKPSLMPVILSTQNPPIPEKRTETYAIQIERNYVTIRGLKFLGSPLLNNWHCCVSRIEANLDDLVVTQCMFIGDPNSMDIYCALLAAGNRFVVDHCVFSKCHASAAFWEGLERIEGRGCAMRYCIVDGGLISGVWTCQTAKDFEFHHNIVTGCDYFWMRKPQDLITYILHDCIVTNNKYYSGYGVETGPTGQTGPEVTYDENNVVKAGRVVFEKDKSKNSYLHVVAGTLGSGLGAGLFAEPAGDDKTTDPVIKSNAVSKEQEMATESGSSSFQLKPLDDEWFKWLAGEWEGWAKSDKGEHKDWIKGKCSVKIEFGLNEQFLIYNSGSEVGEMTHEQIQSIKDAMGASDEEIERLQQYGFKELQFHTIDPRSGERIGYLFDSARCIARGIGRLEGNKEIMEWQWSGEGQGATSTRIIEKISDDELAINHKYTLPDGSKMEDKIEMTRKVNVKGYETEGRAHKMGVRFNMIGVFVSDLQETIGFYQDVIGLKVKETGESYAEFEHEGIRFAVFERAKVPEWLGLEPVYPSGVNGTFELAIDLPYFKDVDSKFAQLVNAGAKPVMEPKDMPWGQRSCMLADPDGNLIEIGSFNSAEQDG